MGRATLARSLCFSCDEDGHRKADIDSGANVKAPSHVMPKPRGPHRYRYLIALARYLHLAVAKVRPPRGRPHMWRYSLPPCATHRGPLQFRPIVTASGG